MPPVLTCKFRGWIAARDPGSSSGLMFCSIHARCSGCFSYTFQSIGVEQETKQH